MSLSQAVNDESNIFVGRVHRLKLFKLIDRLGVLLVQVVGIGYFEFRVSQLRAKWILGPELGQDVNGTRVAFFREVSRALFI
jgi:hypothetical protein